MKSLRERAIVSWFLLTFLNFVDLILYLESLRWPLVNEGWLLRSWEPNKVIAAKALMPIIVAAILLIRTTERIVKVMWFLCGLYAAMIIWNVIQFAWR